MALHVRVRDDSVYCYEPRVGRLSCSNSGQIANAAIGIFPRNRRKHGSVHLSAHSVLLVLKGYFTASARIAAGSWLLVLDVLQTSWPTTRPRSSESISLRVAGKRRSPRRTCAAIHSRCRGRDVKRSVENRKRRFGRRTSAAFTHDTSEAAYGNAGQSPDIHRVCTRYLGRVIVIVMPRKLIAVILMLVIGLQGPMAALAVTAPLMSTSCQTAAVSHSEVSPKDCCPNGQHAMGCCLDNCLTHVGVTVSQTVRFRYERSAPSLPVSTSTFSSRGDSPLIRPPIL